MHQGWVAVVGISFVKKKWDDLLNAIVLRSCFPMINFVERFEKIQKSSDSGLMSHEQQSRQTEFGCFWNNLRHLHAPILIGRAKFENGNAISKQTPFVFCVLVSVWNSFVRRCRFVNSFDEKVFSSQISLFHQSQMDSSIWYDFRIHFYELWSQNRKLKEQTIERQEVAKLLRGIEE